MQAAPELAEGEIRRGDQYAAKLTIKHGELKNLEMGPMTMVFRVKDKTVLAQGAPGYKVRFAAERIEGALTVTQIEVDKP